MTMARLIAKEWDQKPILITTCYEIMKICEGLRCSCIAVTGLCFVLWIQESAAHVIV